MNKKVIEYKVVKIYNSDTFETHIALWLRLGFQPQGGISTIRDEIGIAYIQAMVRYEN